LAEESFLTDDFLRQLINVGEVDILVGLPTHNNAKTIGSIVSTIQSGLLRGFPRERAVIINVDAGSRDGTPELVTGISIDDMRPGSNLNALRTLHSITTDCDHNAEHGVAFRTILAAAELLRAKACVVMSPESANVEPAWLSTLLHPIYRDGFDLAAPTYCRQKFDGLLVTNLLYPMARALYGVKIREPYSAEFGFSGRLASQFLAQNRWDDGAGAELRLTLAAVTGKYRICQSYLGEKIHIERRAGDLVPVLRETVGALFSALEPDFPTWSAVSGSEAIPTNEVEHGPCQGSLRVNRKRLREMFVNGVKELESVFQSILVPDTLAELQRVALLGEEEFEYPAELWVKTVYEFAASYRKSVINRDHIIQAMAPLFRGRAFTFITESRNASAADVENNIENLCLEFERLKPYLQQMWSV
jgi:hypothetical protein